MTKLTVICIGIAFLLSLFLMMGVTQFYTRRMPSQPDLMLGRSLPVKVNYGKIVYVNATERRWLYGTYITLAITGVAFAVTAVGCAMPGRVSDL